MSADTPVPALKARALRALAQREHSRAELARKLEGHGDASSVAEVLARMDELGLQSDARFAAAYVRSHAGRFGRRRLEQELQQRGVGRDDIAQALEAELGDDEPARARSVWAKRFDASPTDAQDWARQARFLSARGFSPDVIRTVLKAPFDESA